MEETSAARFKHWQTRMFRLMWMTYASFYLIRVNISVAAPEIMREYDLSKIDMGMILSSQFVLYAIGQFVNGQLGDRLNAKKQVTIGLIMSAIMNIAFGFSAGLLTLMIVIWGANGLFQSMGWGPTVKAMSNWFTSKDRSRISGRLGTSYILGGAFSWLLAGIIISSLSWQYTFIIPSVICVMIALNWFAKAENAPEEVSLPNIEDQENGIGQGVFSKDEHIGYAKTLRITLLNPYVWTAALALFGINIVRYGFLDWAPTYLFEKEGATVSISTFKALAFPVSGACGAVFAGWASMRYFKNKKAPIALAMLVLLVVSCYLFPTLGEKSWTLSLVMLMFIGFFTFGPHVLIITALPADLGTRKAASSVTGFIDAIGYLGAGLTGVGTGYLVERTSWDSAFHFWMSGAVLASAMMLVLWRFEKKNLSVNL